MKLLDYFTKNKKLKSEKVETKNASLEQINFTNYALEIFSHPLDKYGFHRQKTVIEKNSSSITFRRETNYIKIQASTYPLDMNNCYNVILGDGDSEDFFEYDWNSVALWRMKKAIYPNVKAQEFSFPLGDSAEHSLKKALNELLKFGEAFLDGDMELFLETRKAQNKDREPYKIHSPDKHGNYKTVDEPLSSEKKKKYS